MAIAEPVGAVAIPSGRRKLVWLMWAAVPTPLRGMARAQIAWMRRLRARDTPTPLRQPGDPLVPIHAVSLRTRQGGFWFDAADQKLTPWIRTHATWEQDVGRLFAAVVRPGMTAVDVGANVGFHSATLSRLVGASGVVHAFEPMPDSLELLRANLWRHTCANVLVHPVAVVDAPGRVTLTPDPEGLSGSHLGAEGVVVDATTLDAALDGSRVHVMKIDVEGAEPLVLRGASAVIERSPGLIAIVEFRGSEHLDGSSPASVLELYESLGFGLHLLTADGRALPATQNDVLHQAQRAETVNIVLRKR